MVKFLPDKLTGREWRALERLSNDANTASMSEMIPRRLELMGLAQKFEGVLLITDEGLLQLKIGKEKPAG